MPWTIDTPGGGAAVEVVGLGNSDRFSLLVRLVDKCHSVGATGWHSAILSSEVTCGICPGFVDLLQEERSRDRIFGDPEPAVSYCQRLRIRCCQFDGS